MFVRHCFCLIKLFTDIFFVNSFFCTKLVSNLFIIGSSIFHVSILAFQKLSAHWYNIKKPNKYGKVLFLKEVYTSLKFKLNRISHWNNSVEIFYIIKPLSLDLPASRVPLEDKGGNYEQNSLDKRTASSLLRLIPLSLSLSLSGGAHTDRARESVTNYFSNGCC